MHFVQFITIGTEVTDLKKVKERLIASLYSFEINRSKYELCPSNIGFFQPFKTPSDVQQQLKTTLVSPLVGLFSIVPNILYLIKSLLIMAVSIPCINPNNGFYLEQFVSILIVPNCRGAMV